jgi:hypothetical protein
MVGNDALGRWDYLGLTEESGDCDDCNRALEAVRSNFSAQIEKLNDAGCPTPMTCQCCGEFGETYGGYFQTTSNGGRPIPGKRNTGEIVICFEGEKTQWQMKKIVEHELIHAWQSCNGYAGSSCRWKMCMEIQAYTYTYSHITDPAIKKEKIRAGAKSSTKAVCNDYEYNQDFEEVYETCAKRSRFR